MNAESPAKSRRSGGRSARHALRAAPLAEDTKPVRMGMEGGRYRPFDDSDLEKINEAVLEVLETIGLSGATDTCIEACVFAGAILGEDGRLRFPRKVVQAAIEIANRDFTLCARDPKYDVKPQGSKVHFGTAGAAVHIVDVENNNYRESYLADIYDAARITDLQDNIHFFQRPMVARDIENDRDLDLNTIYACLAGTQKHVGVSFSVADNVAPGLEMIYAVAGGEEKFRERPFVSASICFVVPPLRFAEDACEVLEACVAGGVPVLLLSAGQSGATAPAAIAGSVVQATAEVLAGLVYINALKPGHPAIFGTWPFVSDLRTGAMSGGSGEQALLSAGCAQMANYYNLPGGAAAGMSDSKMPDEQAGYEKGCSTVVAGLAGLNLVYEAAGMHASLMGFSLESLIIDNDILGQALRVVRGIEVNDSTLSLDSMRDVCLGGPEHYLGHEQTLSLMQSEYIYPRLGNRMSPKEWEEAQKPVLVENAIIEKRRILNEYFPEHIAPDIDAKIRAEFSIYLSEKYMRP